MKLKIKLLSIIWIFLFSALCFTSEAAIKTSVDGADLQVTSDRQGIGGYQGCEETTLREVPAFVFNLYRLESKSSAGNQCSGNGHWKIHAQKLGSENKTIKFENLPDGEYKVVGFYGTANGCTIKNQTKKAIVYEKDEEQIVQIRNNVDGSLEPANSSFASVSFKVFPNPANDLVNIQLKEGILTSAVKISITNLLGQEVMDLSDYDGDCENQCQVNLSGLPAGAFIVLLRDSEGQILHQERIVLIKD